MHRIAMLMMTVFLCMRLSSFAAETPKKIAIVKADDIRCVTPKWKRFFALSREKGVKVSAGIICNSLQGSKDDYQNWLRELSRSGWVEFWNHGWDHKRWTTEKGKARKEFSGSGYTHQKKHFDDAQQAMTAVLGKAPVAFGAPYNAIDTDTVKAMETDGSLQLVFCYGKSNVGSKVQAPMRLRGEHDGTGKPNFKKFKAAYKPDVAFSAIQFHPNGFKEEHFEEYAKILDFLLAEGWTFVLPSDYLTRARKQ